MDEAEFARLPERHEVCRGRMQAEESIKVDETVIGTEGIEEYLNTKYIALT